MRTMRALAVVLLLVVGVSACGSDDGGSVTSKASGSSTGSDSEDYGSGGDADAGAAGSGTAVDIKDFSFSPKELKAEAGQEITITNDDSTEHTFTLDDGSYDSGHIKAGSKATHTFDKAGSYSYHCEIHSTMKGTVEVS